MVDLRNNLLTAEGGRGEDGALRPASLDARRRLNC